MGRKLLLCCGLLLAMAGCGGGGSPYYGGSAKSASGGYTGSAPPSYTGSSAGYAPAGQGYAPTDAPAPVQQRNTSVVHDESEPVAGDTQRPGLGTQWGEARVSRVHDVSFARADDDHPFAVAALNYNDRDGVEALASRQAVRSGTWREIPTGGGAITVSIRGEGGELLSAVKVADRTFVVGQEGQRYSIVLVNHTNHRFEAVATVDGLDVVNGQTGDLHNRGYVMMPFGTVEVDGFRQSHDAVAAFRFSRVADSYAAQTSGDRNVGVIGVAFFAERGDSFVPWQGPVGGDDTHLRDTASPFPNDPRFAHPPR